MKRALAAAAVVAAPATITTSVAADCSNATCLERVARKQCSSLRFNRCLDRASLTYRVPKGWLYRVSWCESRWQQFARNASGSTSYFQFLPSTWATTRYRFRWIYSPRFQALAAAEMYRAGRASEWVCN
jgi:hypothetical protein